MKSDLKTRIDQLTESYQFGEPTGFSLLLEIVRDLVHKVEEFEPEEMEEAEIQDILSTMTGDLEYIAILDGRFVGSINAVHGTDAVAKCRMQYPGAVVYLKVGGQ